MSVTSSDSSCPCARMAACRTVTYSPSVTRRCAQLVGCDIKDAHASETHASAPREATSRRFMTDSTALRGR